MAFNIKAFDRETWQLLAASCPRRRMAAEEPGSCPRLGLGDYGGSRVRCWCQLGFGAGHIWAMAEVFVLGEEWTTSNTQLPRPASCGLFDGTSPTASQYNHHGVPCLEHMKPWRSTHPNTATAPSEFEPIFMKFNSLSHKSFSPSLDNKKPA